MQSAMLSPMSFASHSLVVGLGLGLSVLVAGCEEESKEDTHGFVKIEFRRLDSETESPYTGTTELSISLGYDSCYQNFYATQPNYAIDGVDGALAFGTEEDGGEGWKDRLCDGSLSGEPECTVTGFNQVLDTDPQHLTVEYAIMGELENRTIKFGPLPLPNLTMCEGGGPGIVRLQAAGVRGGSQGNELWTMSSFGPSEAAPGQGQAIAIRSERND